MEDKIEEAIRHIVLGHLVNWRVENSDTRARDISESVLRYLANFSRELQEECKL